MINWLIRWSLHNRLAVVLVSVIIMLAGGYLATTMPIDVFPDLTAPTVTILCEGHGMAPEEMESQVTFPIEATVNGASAVRRVRSATAIGISVVWVEFEWGTDIHRARQTVAERLATLTGKLPAQVETPILAPVSSIMGEIMFVSLTSQRHSLLDLKTIASTGLRRRLLSIPGVAQVTALGGEEKQYQVVLSPSRLRAYGIGINEVAEAMREGNENVSAGFAAAAGEEFVIQGVGRMKTVEDISRTVIATRGGVPIRIHELGIVRIGPAIKRGMAAASRRGADWEPIVEPGVLIAIQKQVGANTLELTRELDRVLDQIQATLPEGMLINKNLFRQAGFIEASLNNTLLALRDGSVLVVIIVTFFLWSLRSSIITLLAIPLSLVTSIIALKFTGGSINTMTLGGMAIAIGALVDDAIIDVENVVRRLRQNTSLPLDERRPVLEVIYDASVEVRASIVFATIIIVLVFSPIFFLSGIEGRLLRPLGLAFCLALTASLITALTLTPALCSYLLPRSRTIVDSGEPWLVRRLKDLYSAPLGWAMRRPMFVIAPGILALAISIFIGSRLGRGFLPEFNEGALVVGLVTAPGTSIEQSDALAGIVEKSLMRHPEIVAIGRRTGRAEQDEHVQGVEASEIDLTLDMQAPVRMGLQRRTRAQLLESLRADLAAIPGVQATLGQPISHRIDHMLSGTRASIAVKVFGDDLRKLRDLAGQIQQIMEPVDGVVDLSTEQQASVALVRVDFDRDAMARFGLRAADVAQAMEASCQGVRISAILEGHNSFDLVLRVAESPKAGGTLPDPRLVSEIPVEIQGGVLIPLRAVAGIAIDRGPNFISRENAQRKIVVMCNVAGRDLGGVVDEIQEAVAAKVVLPSGYHVEFGGQFESATQTRRTLALLGVIVVLGIGFLLHIVFGSMRDALLIMVNLPLALIGGVVGILLFDAQLSIASIIGFITVFGIAARNGILMVSHIRHLQRHEGVTDLYEAVRRGAMERLAPILMTALAAGLAMIPFALAHEEPGTEILSPMAVVILTGLLSSTVLNMLVVPALFVGLGAAAPVRTKDSPEGQIHTSNVELS